MKRIFFKALDAYGGFGQFIGPFLLFMLLVWASQQTTIHLTVRG